jgi:hypothetical protein
MAGMAGMAVTGSGMSDSAKQMRAAYAGFEGAAGVVRFKDGAVESEFVTRGLGKGISAATPDGPSAASLPGTTAAAISLTLPKGWASKYLDQVEGFLGDSTTGDSVTQLEKQTGLQLPEDVETLLGKGLTVSLDSSTDLEALTSSPDPTKVPAGLRIEGDAGKITAIVEKLKSLAGAGGDIVSVRSKGDTVAIGTDKDYVATLLEDGDLGDTPAFTTVVPEAGRATSVLYVNFDAGSGWAAQLADLVSDGDAQVKANIKPLDAFGASTWQDDDDVQHALLRLTTD